jgi:GMP synthase-like glutamine amidotransferase
MILVIKQVNLEGLGVFSFFLREKNIKLNIVSMENKQVLPPLEKCKGMIVLGGPMNVYQEKKYPFLKEEENYLKQALQRQIPILGICLGAQLLAKVSGAKVTKAKKEEIGWYEVNLEEKAKKDPLFAGLDKELIVFQWHQDTFDLPKRFVLLATSKGCKNQVFRVGENSWGLQFHPEMNKKQIISWIKNYDSNLDKDKIVDQYFRYQDKYFDQSKKICGNFMELIRIRNQQRIKS